MSENTEGSVWGSDVVKGYEKESGGGGGGWVCHTNVVLGYKVFAQGMSNDETFFPYKIGDENSKKKARFDANAFKDKYNESVPAGGKKATNPSNAIRIELDKEQTYNKDTSTWDGNRVQDTPLWTDAYKGLISPHLVESGAGEGWQWALIQWAPDPWAEKNNKTIINQVTGEETTPLVMFVAKVFLTKQEALDYAAELEAGKSPSEESDSPPFALDDDDEEQSSDVPDGYDQESWNSVVPFIEGELEAGTPIKQIADDYGVSVAVIAKLKK